MGYWGWRSLILAWLISVWVAGCTIAHKSAPTATPTERPQITLTVRNHAFPMPSTPPARYQESTSQPQRILQPSITPLIYVVREGDTLLDIALKFGVDVEMLKVANHALDPRALQVGQPLIIPPTPMGGLAFLPTSTPPRLSLAPPACYSQRADQIVCFGRVDNPFDRPVQRVQVMVRLLDAEGVALKEQVVGIDQRLIPPGEFAPYRVRFDVNGERYVQVDVVLVSADVADGVGERFATLSVEDEIAGFSAESYSVSATLYNPGSQTADAIRLIVTLLDDQGKITSYRGVEIDGALLPGARLPVSVTVMPLPTTKTVTHRLYVEARVAGE